MTTINCYNQVNIAATKAFLESMGRKVCTTGLDNRLARKKLCEACRDLNVSPIFVFTPRA